MNMKQSWVAFLAAGVLSTVIAMAADQPPTGGGRPAGGGPTGGPGGGGGFGMGGPGGRGNFQGRGGMLGLDEQQRQLFQEAIQKDDAKLREWEQKLRAAQKELLVATLAVNYDEKAVRDKAEAVSRIQTEITMLRAKALSTVAPTMKPEQIQQVIDSPSGMLLLNGGGMGGGFPGMGPGRGGAGGGFPGGPGGGGPPRGGGDQGPRER
jgi:Spy/CpxP family protein refolding chaperone